MFTRCPRDCSFKWEHCENEISELNNYIYVSNISSNSLNPYVLIALHEWRYFSYAASRSSRSFATSDSLEK
ncbi:hypothetical protein F383_35702 [Gossypium arboreum]|uniref:Uncharacterized protein n=1 Tax=Gossypium arboreum TaxID=29729 RepID=A0A0B0NA74_GOSAR|nr:hypothetical protein F383_35702 [Gossypium arboreum]